MAILPKLFGKKLETPEMPAKPPPQVRDGRSASDIEALRNPSATEPMDRSKIAGFTLAPG